MTARPRTTPSADLTNYPRVLHHGAVTGVTGSCHEWQVDADHSLLIDCGLFQGAETSGSGRAGRDRLTIDFDIATLQALIATHVHIDHVGRIPWLLAAGFKGPILCSPPSAKLLPIVLEDAFKLSFTREPAEVKRYRKLVEQRLQPIPYNRWHTVVDRKGLKARIRLQRAGHILGSAYVECEVKAAGQPKHRTVFSGDLGAPHAPILPAPKPPYGCDTLVIESTYGDRNHEDRKTRRQRLEKTLQRALQDEGTVLIPAFSIGRTQELLYELEDILFRRQQQKIKSDLPWDQLPVILDSPLASKFTRVYRQLQPYWDDEALKRVTQGRKPLGFDQLLTVDRHDAHLRMVRHLAKTKRPAVVVAGSGMCNAGRIVNYLKAMLDEPRHNILFVGYQAAGTPGRDIQQFGPKGGWVALDGDRHDIRAGITTLGGYSAHADQAGLLAFAAGMRKWPRTVRVVHGDPAAKQTLARKLRQQARAKGGELRVEIPS